MLQKYTQGSFPKIVNFRDWSQMQLYVFHILHFLLWLLLRENALDKLNELFPKGRNSGRSINGVTSIAGEENLQDNENDWVDKRK
ncbi:hypothetical protein [Leptospira alexanderi]|uniref:hypothetical protein n=1 Tax=Leptospira alexanderi TaxID=100053 RepID=UPI000990CAE6|nr:hypothetical protein [Leptospira alexanderi]